MRKETAQGKVLHFGGSTLLCPGTLLHHTPVQHARQIQDILLILFMTDELGCMDEVNPGPLWELLENNDVLWPRRN